MKYLITGCNGFVAGHYLEFLATSGKSPKVLGVGRNHSPVVPAALDFSYFLVDLIDADAIAALIAKEKPDYVIHLAAFSSVGASWKDPVACFSNNTNIFLNIIDAVRRVSCESRVLSVGSSEQYGDQGLEALPISEDAELKPISPYAAARCGQEILSKVYAAAYDVDIVMTRSFNHIGQRQTDQFVVSYFASQFAMAEREGKKSFRLQTGDCDVIRDFVDVRDVVLAYESILDGAESGSVYNVCSGVGQSLRVVIQHLSEITGIKAEICQSKNLLRPAENRTVVGARDAIFGDLGWEPAISFDHSLREIMEYWRRNKG